MRSCGRRFVYDGDSVTDIAHQLGYFETISTWRNYHELRDRLNAVTVEQVQAAAREIPDPFEPDHWVV